VAYFGQYPNLGAGLFPTPVAWFDFGVADFGSGYSQTKRPQRFHCGLCRDQNDPGKYGLSKKFNQPR